MEEDLFSENCFRGNFSGYRSTSASPRQSNEQMTFTCCEGSTCGRAGMACDVLVFVGCFPEQIEARKMFVEND